MSRELRLKLLSFLSQSLDLNLKQRNQLRLLLQIAHSRLKCLVVRQSNVDGLDGHVNRWRLCRDMSVLGQLMLVGNAVT